MGQVHPERRRALGRYLRPAADALRLGRRRRRSRPHLRKAPECLPHGTRGEGVLSPSLSATGTAQGSARDAFLRISKDSCVSPAANTGFSLMPASKCDAPRSIPAKSVVAAPGLDSVPAMNVGALCVLPRRAEAAKRRTPHESLGIWGLRKRRTLHESSGSWPFTVYSAPRERSDTPENGVLPMKVRAPRSLSRPEKQRTPHEWCWGEGFLNGVPPMKDGRTPHEGTAFLPGTMPYRRGKNGVPPMKERRTLREKTAYLP